MKELSLIIRQRNIKIFFIAIVAYVDGLKRIEKTIDELDTKVILHTCETLDETCKCFGEKSRFYSDLKQREAAFRVAENYGKKLEKKCPLGYGNLQLAVTFEHNCPNDSLPILWSESTVPKWMPLFKRN